MMSDQEQESARLGMLALDQALVAVGQQAVDQNPDFHFAEPVLGAIPNVALQKPGVAPLRFVFGLDLDVWIGPFSEVVLLTVTDASFGLVQRRIEELLRSSVRCASGKRSNVITLQLPGAAPWLRLRELGGGPSHTLEPVYAPYA